MILIMFDNDHGHEHDHNLDHAQWHTQQEGEMCTSDSHCVSGLTCVPYSPRYGKCGRPRYVW